MANLQEPHFTEPVYRIGAVARLTGISPVTIRAWERRYQAVVPRRTGGGSRLYSREDISRLALIRRLVDAGDAIGTVARLDLQALQDRLDRFEAEPEATARPIGLRRLGVLGDALPARILRLGEARLGGLEVVVLERDRQRFEAAIAATRPQILVVERPTLDADTGPDLERLLDLSGAQRALVIYGFGTQEAIQALDTDHTLPLRAPVGLPELRRICLEGNAAPPTPAPEPALPPPRRFDNRQLSVIAAAATSVDCECPHHLVDLLFNLLAFEDYSGQCRHRYPEDAALHGRLQATTGQARALLEGALAELVAAEGIDLGGGRPGSG